MTQLPDACWRWQRSEFAAIRPVLPGPSASCMGPFTVPLALFSAPVGQHPQTDSLSPNHSSPPCWHLPLTLDNCSSWPCLFDTTCKTPDAGLSHISHACGRVTSHKQRVQMGRANRQPAQPPFMRAQAQGQELQCCKPCMPGHCCQACERCPGRGRRGERAWASEQASQRVHCRIHCCLLLL